MIIKGKGRGRELYTSISTSACNIDPNMDNTQQELVRAGYNTIADRYLEWIQHRPTLHQEKLDQILKYLDARSEVLELGCGAGLPVTASLAQHVAKVVANDCSEKQIELARLNAPKATFIHGDMTRLEFPPNTFDAVLAFYSLFHLPRESHGAMIGKCHSWLKPGGLLLFNYSAHAEEGIFPVFLGTQSFFSSFGREKIVELVESQGFEIIMQEFRAQGNVDDFTDPDNDTSFLWVLARKIAK
jgi:2-polyprenyl-3-methyl-5-hydroxy-6-metoxy-1,4-benzoquinol methylase